MALWWRTDDRRWLTGPSIPGRAIDEVGFPEPGDPGSWRTIEVHGVAPGGAAFAVATPSAPRQFSEGTAEFRGLRFEVQSAE